MMGLIARWRTSSAWQERRPPTAEARGGERGQTNVEYALVIVGISVAVLVAVILLGGRVGDRTTTSVSGTGGILRPPTIQCDRHYSGSCVPPAPPDLDCSDLRARGIRLPVRVVGSDPHHLDPDGDRLGC